MLLRVDHYSSLARAVARLDRDSYEARGAIYDRALFALEKRIAAANPPYSQADIDMELLSFRDAIRRIEFGDMDEVPLAPEYEPPPELPAAMTPADDVTDTDRHATDTDRHAPDAKVASKIAVKRRSVFGRVAGRSVIAALLVGIGIAGYAHATGQLDLSPLAQLFDDVASINWTMPGGSKTTAGGFARLDPRTANQPAEFYESEGTDPRAKRTVGKAQWRVRSEPGEAGAETATVVVLETEFAERGFAMTMTIRRDASAGASMSHLIEFQFWGSDRFPIEDVARVVRLQAKQEGDKNGEALVGQLASVAPGMFLMGLSASPNDLQHNIEVMRTMPRFEIPLLFTDGRTATLVIDKGPEGERQIAEALGKWGE